MNKSIWKFDLEITGAQKIKMPGGAEILSIQEQGGTIRIWALVNPESQVVIRHFEIFGTGHNIYCDMGIDRKYLATVQERDRPLVWHIFERVD